jgi:ferredoxin
MKLWLRAERCAGHALCHAVDSTMFPLDDSGYSTMQPHDVAADHEVHARRGVAMCPEQALVLESQGAD